MKRNTLNIIYWVSTILISGFMIFSSWGGLSGDQQAMEFMNGYLGYPVYFIKLISAAKIAGSLAILAPFTPGRLKEWAYAGLLFDLLGAIYSIVSVSGKFSVDLLFIVLPILVWGVSYYCWHKRKTAL